MLRGTSIEMIQVHVLCCPACGRIIFLDLIFLDLDLIFLDGNRDCVGLAEILEIVCGKRKLQISHLPFADHASFLTSVPRTGTLAS